MLLGEWPLMVLCEAGLVIFNVAATKVLIQPWVKDTLIDAG